MPPMRSCGIFSTTSPGGVRPAEPVVGDDEPAAGHLREDLRQPLQPVVGTARRPRPRRDDPVAVVVEGVRELEAVQAVRGQPGDELQPVPERERGEVGAARLAAHRVQAQAGPDDDRRDVPGRQVLDLAASAGTGPHQQPLRGDRPADLRGPQQPPARREDAADRGQRPAARGEPGAELAAPSTAIRMIMTPPSSAVRAPRATIRRRLGSGSGVSSRCSSRGSRGAGVAAGGSCAAASRAASWSSRRFSAAWSRGSGPPPGTSSCSPDARSASSSAGSSRSLASPSRTCMGMPSPAGRHEHRERLQAHRRHPADRGAPEPVEHRQHAVAGGDREAVDPGPLVGDHGQPAGADAFETGRRQPPVGPRTAAARVRDRAEQPRDRGDGADQRGPQPDRPDRQQRQRHREDGERARGHGAPPAAGTGEAHQLMLHSPHPHTGPRGTVAPFRDPLA
ncbi:hypothetical protein [Actinomadura madurae]|uniref:hypothetical protein n=1 Tax=Actinomadura madurae TaxID=1993 RepID=UPI0020D2185B|nr:hypothetical protein [Actinomadura madurae]MCQ0006011.1 hypothetical protein [Actinomadura madurae]